MAMPVNTLRIAGAASRCITHDVATAGSMADCIPPATVMLNLMCRTLAVWTNKRSRNTLMSYYGNRFATHTDGMRQDMRFASWLLAAGVLLASIAASHAAVRITEDRGGRIGTYVDRFQDLRSSGEQVVIDGLCASACTIVLGAVPHDRICVTSRASLGFHAAWDFGANGRVVTNREATRMLYAMYPPPVRRWISRRGGLTRHMIFLDGAQLASMYRPCYINAEAGGR